MKQTLHTTIEHMKNFYLVLQLYIFALSLIKKEKQ